MDDQTAPALPQRFLDRLEAEEVLIRYTHAIDRGEWDLLDDVFTPDAEIDYTESGGIADRFEVVKPWLAENLPLFPKRMHTLGQVSAERTADGELAVTAYFDNPMLLPTGDGKDLLVQFGGMYHHTMVRTPDGWRSRKLHEQIVWKQGL